MRHPAVLAVVLLLGITLLGVAAGQTQAAAVFAAGCALVIIARREIGVAADPRAPAGRRDTTLIAIVCPDEVAQLPRMLAAVPPDAADVIVLAIDIATDTKLTPAELFVKSQRVGGETDPQLASVLREVVRKKRRPIALMRTAAQDPALITLEVARQLAVSHVVVGRAEGHSLEEQQYRAVRAWGDLAKPKNALKVHLVDVRPEPPTEREFVLSPSSTSAARAA